MGCIHDHPSVRVMPDISSKNEIKNNRSDKISSYDGSPRNQIDIFHTTNSIFRHETKPRQRKKGSPIFSKKRNSGIINIGNSCYLNSALQCIYHSQYLNQQLQKQDQQFSDFNSKGQFVQLYIKMCKKMQQQNKAFDPSNIKRRIQKYNEMFIGNKQHDSGQVVNTILNILDEQTNKTENLSIKKIYYSYQETDEDLCLKYIQRFKAMSFSLIDILFTGLFKTTYHCLICNRQKRLFQKFSIVYLPMTFKNSSLYNLSDCLSEFQEGQLLNWDCGYCQKETDNVKTMKIYKANKTLIFCLKRFKQNRKKIRTPINIPFELDLNQSKYVLYAAIIHQGEYFWGHYIAFCYNYLSKCWAEYNDQFVTKVTQQQVRKNIKNAYLLFYKLKKVQDNSERSVSIPDHQEKIHTQQYAFTNKQLQKYNPSIHNNIPLAYHQENIMNINKSKANTSSLNADANYLYSSSRLNNDDIVQQTPLINQAKNKAKQQRLATNKMIKKSQYLKLKNVIHSSYLNSVLQSLYQTQVLLITLQKSLKSGPFVQQYKKMCKYPFEFQQKTLFDTSKIRSLLSYANSRLKGQLEQDPHEAVQTIFTIINKETNQFRIPNTQKIYPINRKYQVTDQAKFNTYIQIYNKKSYSIIDKIFTGYRRVQFYCLTCKKGNVVFEQFNIVNLDIYPSKSRANIKFQKQLTLFSQPYQVKHRCNQCNREITSHYLQTLLYQTNKILIFSLKKQKDKKENIYYSVDIPLSLDLNQIFKKYKRKNSNNIYQLYSAITYSSEQNMGYTAYSYDYRNQQWVQTKDNIVNKIHLEQVEKKIKKACLLFYRLKEQLLIEES